MLRQQYIRYLREIEGLSVNEISKQVGINWRTAKKYADQPNWNEQIEKKRRKKRVMGQYMEIIDTWLEEDRLLLRKQRHTGVRIYKRLRDEYALVNRLRDKLKRADILILDEVGYVPFNQTGSELLFNIIADCYERQSVIVTSNLEFGQWTSVFGDTKLTSALVDRLVHHAHTLSFTGESFRFKQAMERIPL